MDQQTLHRALLDPAVYPEDPGPISFRETHISRLYLTPDFVYKIKKPVDLGFLNFSTLERRRHFCRQEVRLNRRFSPDTYLGVLAVRSHLGRIRIEGPGETVEYAVWMRRLPEHRMLDRLVAADDPHLPGEMGRLGGHLALLLLRAETIRSRSGQAAWRTMRRNWRENIDQCLPLVGRTLSQATFDRLSGYGAGFMEERRSLFLQREAEGFVRDGHGDLHAEHICLTDPIRLYDCIEFNRRFRVADIAAELAFLLMDLDFRGRTDLARRLREAFVWAWDADPGLSPLLPFYQVYRAAVRGKVESLIAAGAGMREESRMAAEQRARGYFNLALGYLVPPALLLTCGLMGSGKTTLARALAVSLRARLLRSDVLRKELAGMTPSATIAAPFGEGIYDPAQTERTYGKLLELAFAALERGETVVVDASFSSAAQRRRFQEAAATAGRPVWLLHATCPRPTLLARLAQRQTSGSDASDGRPALLEAQEAVFEPPPSGRDVIQVDTGLGVDYNTDLVLNRLAQDTERHW